MWSLILDVLDDDKDDATGPGTAAAERVASRKVVKEVGRARFVEAFWSPTAYEHPDGLMLRFLRARKWDVDKGAYLSFPSLCGPPLLRARALN